MPEPKQVMYIVQVTIKYYGPEGATSEDIDILVQEAVEDGAYTITGVEYDPLDTN